jgi:hypothetical protein
VLASDTSGLSMDEQISKIVPLLKIEIIDARHRVSGGWLRPAA